MGDSFVFWSVRPCLVFACLQLSYLVSWWGKFDFSSTFWNLELYNLALKVFDLVVSSVYWWNFQFIVVKNCTNCWLLFFFDGVDTLFRTLLLKIVSCLTDFNVLVIKKRPRIPNQDLSRFISNFVWVWITLSYNHATHIESNIVEWMKLSLHLPWISWALNKNG